MEMTKENETLLAEFKNIHDKYVQNPQKWQSEFNQTGEEMMAVLRKYENRLCGHSEGGKYGKFSSKLADKFWAMVRAVFPKIDFIGITNS